MIFSGLVSVTFSRLPPSEIIVLVVKASLQAIEYGGDIYMPHGDIKKAKFVSQITEENGLKVTSYGSYYKI